MDEWSVRARRLTADSELKYYRYSSHGGEDGLTFENKSKQFQEQREALSTKIYITDYHKNLLVTHYDPKVDKYVSGRVAQGHLWEEKGVVEVARHMEVVLRHFDVDIGAAVWGQADAPLGRLGFIDIGANIGSYAVGLGGLFLNRAPFTFFAFEPAPDTVPLLSSSLRLNHLSNVYLYPYGLTDHGDIGDTASFVEDSLNKGHDHMAGDQSWSEHDGQTMEIETVPLDLFTHIWKDRYPAMYNGWSNALWLKMDTEGMELSIIRGGLESLFSNSSLDPCFLKVEYRLHQEEMYSLLTSKGYEMVLFDFNSVHQGHPMSREQALKWKKGDAFFAKRDAEECARGKVDNLKTQCAREESEGEAVMGEGAGIQLGQQTNIRVLVLCVLALDGVLVLLAFLRWKYSPNFDRCCPGNKRQCEHGSLEQQL